MTALEPVPDEIPTEVLVGTVRVRVGRCVSCGAPILWAVSTTGRPIPLEITSGLAGSNLEAVDGPPSRTHRGPAPVVRRVDPQLSILDPTTARPRWLSHFVACPDAAGWRRKQRR